MDLYREEILEHWQNPQNFGVMRAADLVIDQINPLCGDSLTFYFKISGGKVENVSFIGSGCAISIASASILSDNIKGKSVKVVSKLTGEKVLELLGGPLRRQGSGGQAVFPPARLKCAFLSLEAVKRIGEQN